MKLLMKNELILLRGLPGSGKTTAAAKIAQRMKTKFNITPLHYEADMYHMVNGVYVFRGENVPYAHEWCYKSTEIALNNNQTVIVSNTFTTKKEMQKYLDLGASFNLTIYKCTGTYGSIHNVPESAMQRMKARWEDIPGELEWKDE